MHQKHPLLVCTIRHIFLFASLADEFVAFKPDCVCYTKDFTNNTPNTYYIIGISSLKYKVHFVRNIL